MKKFKFKIFILSALLLTLSSGLLFYKNLFITENINLKGRTNFEELRYLDLQINQQMSEERRHLEINEQVTNLELSKNKIHDLISIILDFHHNDIAIKSSIRKVEKYFDDKVITINQFQKAINELRVATNVLNPVFLQIQKKKIKNSTENRDFFRECLTDTLLYLSAPSKMNQQQVIEDKKILSQIIGIAKTPDIKIEQYYQAIDKIIKSNSLIEDIFTKTKTESIDDEMAFINNYFKDTNESQNQQGQTFLILIFIAIIFYITTLVVILRKF